MEIEEVIRRFGKPDADHSTAYDEPRPPIVTRWIIYRKAKVRITFVPSKATIEDGPPYLHWEFFGTQDAKTDAVLSADEVNRRMAGQQKRR